MGARFAGTRFFYELNKLKLILVAVLKSVPAQCTLDKISITSHCNCNLHSRSTQLQYLYAICTEC